MAHPKRFGKILLVVVVLGALVPQVVGTPGAIHSLGRFVWHFGWPYEFVVCEGIQRGPLPGELPRDATHTDWVTRMLVPVWWGAHMYPPRTPPLLFATWRPIMFHASSLLINAAYVVVVIAGAAYLAGQMRRRTLLRRFMLAATAAVTVLCVAYYAYVLMSGGKHLMSSASYVFFAYYEPAIIACNVLGALSAIVAGCVLVGGFVQRCLRS